MLYDVFTLEERKAMTKICKKCGVEKEVEKFQSHFDKRRGKRFVESTCKECNRSRDCASSKAYYRKNCEKAKATSRIYHKANRYKVALLDARSVARKRGHSPCTATVDELKAAFTGRCRICGVPEAELNKKLCMDHCHETGDFRGWLCTPCNLGLGGFKNSQDILMEALTYLERPYVIN